MKSHFSKDLQLCSSLLTDLLVCKGAIGGEKLGEGNSIYYSDNTPNAHLLKSVSNSGSHYKFFQKPSQGDLNLLPHGAQVTNHFPARVVNPLSCSAVAIELTKRNDYDNDHNGKRPPGTSVSYFTSSPASALTLSQSTVQTNSTGFVLKKRPCLTQTAAMSFEIFSNNKFIKMFVPDGVSDVSDPTVLKECGSAVNLELDIVQPVNLETSFSALPIRG